MGANGRLLACKKRHGTWWFKLDAGTDDEGNRKRISKGGYETRKEAEEALAAASIAVDSGTWTDAGKLTVSTYMDQWLKRREGTLKPSTVTAYKSHLETHIRPHIGHVKLRDLRAEHIYEVLAAVGEDRSASTVHRVRATLRTALSAAVREHLLTWNPARDLDMPRTQRPEVHPWEPRETGAFLDAVSEDRLGPVFHLAAYLGLRRGEALGLRWDDVDLKNRVLKIAHTISGTTGNTQPCKTCGQVHREVRFETPKTASSVGVVNLDDATVQVLLEQQLRQDTERKEWRDAYLDHGLVFAREDGSPYPPAWVTHRFERLQQGVMVEVEPGNPDKGLRNVRKIRLHDLRHGAAALMIAGGVDIAVVSKALRHSSLGITADTYGHLLPGVGEAAADVRASLIPRGV